MNKRFVLKLNTLQLISRDFGIRYNKSNNSSLFLSGVEIELG